MKNFEYKLLTDKEIKGINGGEGDVRNFINSVLGFFSMAAHNATPMYGMEHDNCCIHDNDGC